MPEITSRNYDKYVDTLKEWAEAYYVKDAPVAADEEWDELYHAVLEFEKKHPELRRPDSPTQRVGGAVQKGFAKARHKTPMWSMEDVFDEEGFVGWINRINKFVGRNKDKLTLHAHSRCGHQTAQIQNLSQTAQLQNPPKTAQPIPPLFCQPKFDGLSLNLQYEGGQLVRAITRGDGEIGEDVTANAKTIRSIPLTIPHKDPIEIRGEVVMPKADFEKLNTERIKQGEQPFANPRNAAAGSLRQHDPKVTAARKLVFYPWGVGQNTLQYETLFDMMNWIYEQGFLNHEITCLCNTLDEVFEFYEKLRRERDQIPVLLDGMVAKINEIALHDILGYTVKFPRWMVAYKFPALEKVTTVKSIDLQVGRTGVITPVANVEPVEIDGAVVSRVTLHNFDEIERLGLQIGDQVLIIRSGDVIPKITKVLKDRRTVGEKSEQPAQSAISRPTICPVCGKPVLDEGAQIKCQNLACPARIKNSIKHFVSKKAMNIEGMGEKIVEQLFEAGLLKDVTDIYKLRAEQLFALEGFKEKKVTKLLKSIERSRRPQCWKFVYALGIEHVGEVAAKKICVLIARNTNINSQVVQNKRSPIDFQTSLLNLDEEQLIDIDGIGEEIAQSYTNFIKVNRKRIENLLKYVTPMVTSENGGVSNVVGNVSTTGDLRNSKQQKENIFYDKTIVLTGSMSQPRDQIKEILERHGANVTGSVSKNTDYVITGDRAGSKLKKARELGVKIMSEEEMWKALGVDANRVNNERDDDNQDTKNTQSDMGNAGVTLRNTSKTADKTENLTMW